MKPIMQLFCSLFCYMKPRSAAEGAAILLHIQTYDADSAAILPLLLLYEADFAGFLLLQRFRSLF